MLRAFLSISHTRVEMALRAQMHSHFLRGCHPLQAVQESRSSQSRSQPPRGAVPRNQLLPHRPRQEDNGDSCQRQLQTCRKGHNTKDTSCKEPRGNVRGGPMGGPQPAGQSRPRQPGLGGHGSACTCISHTMFWTKLSHLWSMET